MLLLEMILIIAVLGIGRIAASYPDWPPSLRTAIQVAWYIAVFFIGLRYSELSCRRRGRRKDQ